MSQQFHPVFPHMGWSCVQCKRGFAYRQQRYGCPYCPKSPTQAAACAADIAKHKEALCRSSSTTSPTSTTP